MKFTIQDLALAYRKAKVDLYYSSNVRLLAIAEYEEQLDERLAALLEKINGKDEKWVKDKAFLGDWTVAAKSISNLQAEKDDCSSGIIISSPKEKWKHACEALASTSKDRKPSADFRLMAKCSLDFHVLSTLWMLEVGHKYDAKLNKCAYGNRLRRTQDGKHINPYSLGSFVPYLKPFRDWRDKGIAAMRMALNDKKEVVALTADVSSFYHELNPGFMLSKKFLHEILELEFSPQQEKLNRLFIGALEAWSQKTPLRKGLPVGLPASAVVANIALIEFDRLIEQQVAPLYYGRYVDDILLVMEDGKKFKSKVELWEWLFERSNGKIDWVKGEKARTIQFKPDYLVKGKKQSRVIFSNSKNKVFLLSGATGKTMVESIAHQIHERASEWRAMPRLPRSASHVGTDLVAATQSDGEAADNLRKADALTMRRAGFAIKLRDFEAYERDLHPDAWSEHRSAFLDAFVAHVLVLPNFFELAAYLPRVVRLATACEDFEHLSKIISGVDLICTTVSDYCEVSIKAMSTNEKQAYAKDIQSRWKRQLFSAIGESIVAAFPPHLTRQGRQAWLDTFKSFNSIKQIDLPESIEEMQEQHARLFARDLAHMPLRFIGLPKEMTAQRGIPSRKTLKKNVDVRHLLTKEISSGSQFCPAG